MPSGSTNKKRSISLQVPPDAEAGDVLSFVVDGSEIDIPVPLGSKPGDILEIQVGGVEFDDGDREDTEGAVTIDTHEDDSLTVSLSNKRKLHFSTIIASQQDTELTKNQEAERRIDDGTRAHLWPAGKAMTQFLGSSEGLAVIQSIFPAPTAADPDKANSGTVSSSISKSRQNNELSVLELGSGLGVVGLAFAASVRSSLLPVGKVVLSDVQDAMELLQHNILRNKSILDATIVEAIPLLWKTQQEEEEEWRRRRQQQQQQASSIEETLTAQYHLLLASDVLYNAEIIPALLSTVKRHLTTISNSGLILGVRWRKPEIERSFFRALEGWHGKQWHLVHTRHCPLSWESYGNPKDDSSNQYFHQTMISVQGKPHSLAEIMTSQGGNEESPKDVDAQDLLEAMNDEEAVAFENCHIQVYLLQNAQPASEECVNEKSSRKRSFGRA